MGRQAGVALVPLSSLLLPLARGLTGRQCHSGPSAMLPAPGDETPALCLQVGNLVSCHCDPTPGEGVGSWLFLISGSPHLLLPTVPVPVYAIHYVKSPLCRGLSIVSVSLTRLPSLQWISCYS